MISVFVSSTFKDMQGERDILQKEVLPELRSLCHEYGELINLVDLRWGVDTSKLEDDKKSAKVLNVCLDQIDRCKPYMIVLLGQRYGWIPEYRLIENAVSPKQYYDDGIEKSVTALEIEYGALSNLMDSDKYLFFMREDLPLDEMPKEMRIVFGTESEQHAEKLSILKQKIKETFPDRVFSYNLHWDGNNLIGYDQFKHIVTERLKYVIENRIAIDNECPKGEKAIREHLRFIKEQQLYFAGREKLIHRITSAISKYRLVILSGAAGTGKTAIVSKIVEIMSSEECLVIPIICGYTNNSSTAYEAIQLLCTVLADTCGDSRDSSSMNFIALRNYLSELIDLVCTNGRKLLIILDGLDRLIPDDTSIHLNFLPLGINESCTFIVSCRDNYQLPRHFRYRTVTEALHDAEVGEILDIVKHILKINAKELDAATRVVLMTEKKPTYNLLYLSLMLRRIINMDSDDFSGISDRGGNMSAITEYMINLIRQSPDNVDGMVRALYKEVIHHIAPTQTETILKLIALTTHGMSQEDIMGLFSVHGMDWSEIEFARLQKYLYGFLVERGDFDFAYPEIRNTVLSDMSSQEKAKMAKLLITYLNTLPDDVNLKLFNMYNLAYYANDKKAIVDYINRISESDDKYSIKMLARQIAIGIAEGNDEWFNSIFVEGIELGAGTAFTDFIAMYVIPDMQTSNASDVRMRNMGQVISVNNVRLARSVKNKEISAANAFKTTSSNAETIYDLDTALTYCNQVRSAKNATVSVANALRAASSCAEMLFDYDTALMYCCQALGFYKQLYELDKENVPVRSNYRVLLNDISRLMHCYGLHGRALHFDNLARSLDSDKHHNDLTDNVKPIAFDYYDALKSQAADSMKKGEFLYKDGKYEAAIAELKPCTEWMEELCGQYDIPPNRIMLASAMIALSRAETADGNFEHAEEYCDMAGEILENITTEYKYVPGAWETLAEVCELMGKIKSEQGSAEADTYYEEHAVILSQLEAMIADKGKMVDQFFKVAAI